MAAIACRTRDAMLWQRPRRMAMADASARSVGASSPKASSQSETAMAATSSAAEWAASEALATLPCI
jgi:hypothetical protein